MAAGGKMAGAPRAYLGLGSNLGDRRANLERSLVRLESAELAVRRVSSVFESSPVGPIQDQPHFYNAVAEVQTSLAPRALLRRCLEVETQMGRVREVHQGPRLIDIDLLLLGDRVGSWPDLELPHPELAHRAFVLVPLLELAPTQRDPRDGIPLGRRVDPLLRTQTIVKVGRLSTPTEAR